MISLSSFTAITSKYKINRERWSSIHFENMTHTKLIDYRNVYKQIYPPIVFVWNESKHIDFKRLKIEYNKKIKLK